MLSEVTRVVVGCAMTFGPVVVLLSLLNLRDARAAKLREAVLAELPLVELRGLIAIQIRCAVLSRRSLVRIDMVACTREQIWDAITRLPYILPPYVRLAVSGTVDRQFTSTFTLETKGRCKLYPLCQPSPVIG
jgi:hypothetical protein